MKQILSYMLPCVLLLTLSVYNSSNAVISLPEHLQMEPSVPTVESKKPVVSKPPKMDDNTVDIQITAGDKTFSARFYNNETTQALMKQMPLKITMEELNRNEKFYYLSENLPTDPYRPKEIKAGDLMLYGSDCLVLFYESFSTSYSYTRLGFVEDMSGLSDVLGRGSVQVTFNQVTTDRN